MIRAEASMRVGQYPGFLTKTRSLLMEALRYKAGGFQSPGAWLGNHWQKMLLI
ncbi:MAG: hypothetical protein RIG63_08450 [Coleofasciculus chthonoplastes F3-SA18-01]|uniref:hypothetical protein n=1 Tax=Coleofasciculus chthonoplastes TaxID=64178 RepID=UPI0032FD9FDA